jgi:hypothetical protein
MAEPRKSVLDRVTERLDVLTREMAEVVTEHGLSEDPLVHLKAVTEAHGRMIDALLDMVGTLATEIDRLRSQDAPT